MPIEAVSNHRQALGGALEQSDLGRSIGVDQALQLATQALLDLEPVTVVLGTAQLVLRGETGHGGPGALRPRSDCGMVEVDEPRGLVEFGVA
jgi:hypothetical protein